MSAPISHALSLAGADIPVFPCEPNGKKPLTDHGFHEASTDVDQVARWWRRWPTANIAMPTGAATYDVLDVDVRPDGNGWAAYERLRNHGLLRGAVRMVETPSTGLHLYFPGTEQPCGRLVGHWLDLKAQGGYVLLPPSHVRTPDYEGDYNLLDERDGGNPLDWQACTALLAPAQRRDEIANTQGLAHFGVEALADWLRRQTAGNRNNALFWAANRAVEAGESDLRPLLVDFGPKADQVSG
jgi:hypothetical protein